MLTDRPLYQRLLGAGWGSLPPVTRALHAPDPVALFEGRADISRGSHPLARLAAGLLRLPQAGIGVPARIMVSRAGEGELLERWYQGRRFATVQGERAGLLHERFGPLRLGFRLTASPEGIDFHQQRVALWFIPLPSWLAPRVQARERFEPGVNGAEDAHLFDVRLTLPGIGLVIAYRGRLLPVSA
ncbi:DUF4166 domain-containing protein [Maricaulis sp.]|uniref:DUF4166 domain-containing protein n=1 Tax=Maricaulis sp. TaxID=1486257 RepID=UPI003A949B25